ncbi:MAG: hypothetical protein KGJ13_10810 [Patescibacteria group bacterium]|nr:hypothetical protein [Patescibacteria group bacterium]
MRIIPVLFFAALLCGCRPVAQKHEPAGWDYASIQIREPEKADDGRELVTQVIVEYRGGCYFTNVAYSLTDALKAVGDYGWELAWSDGSNCIVKRPQNVWTNGSFAVITAARQETLNENRTPPGPTAFGF